MENCFLVPEFVLKDVLERLDKYVAKALKYNPEKPLDYEVGETVFETFKNARGVKYQKAFVEVFVNNVIPTIGDFELLGVVADEDGMVFANMVPFEKYPFETAPTAKPCEHCNVARPRKTGYIVRNVETKEVLQVGKTCLREYLGYDPKNVLRGLRVAEELGEMMENACGGFGKPTYAVEEVLMLTKYMVDRFGWLSKGRAAEFDRQDATAILVEKCFARETKDDADFLKEARAAVKNPAEKLVEYVKAVRTWLEVDLADVDIGNDYLYNLAQFGGVEEFTNFRRFGLLCSALQAYDRDLKKKELHKAVVKTSEFVGEVKERLRDLVLVQKSCFERNGQWGVTYAYNFTDADGNVFMYWGTVDLEVENGDEVTVDATVKKHEVYNGVKQTHLTRCKKKV